MGYAQHFSTRKTPQSEPIPGSTQVANSAGGFSFQVDDWTRLDRFLILGSEGGSYYASEKKLTIENAQAVLRCIKIDARRTVSRIVEISESGRAPKNDPAIFALAICAGQKIPEALEALPRVCRIGTHLFQFIEAVEQFRGHGRALNRAIGNWYTEKKVESLALQLVKYQQRNGWAHRDLLRLSGVRSNTPDFRWAVGATLGARDIKRYRQLPDGKRELIRTDHYEAVDGNVSPIIQAFEKAKVSTDKREVARLIRDYNMPRECVPTQFLTEPEVWEALLEKMPMTAMIRNLATMTRVGLLAPMSNAVRKVVNELSNIEMLRKSRIHPIAVLLALKTYAQGKGMKSANAWTPVPQIVDALDEAFYKAFGNVDITGKRWMLGVDVSGSMSSRCAGTPLTCCECATAMALVTAHTEPNYHIHAFADSFRTLPISKKSRLDDALRLTRNQNFGGTNCSLPMIYALQHRIPVDIFVVLTDSETWAGHVHPTQALRAYREKMGIPAKEVVVGMVSSQFTIADPLDKGQLDVVGFDTSVPQLISEFARGNL